MFDRIRYLLLQVRNADDPMREHEVEAFARSLETSTEKIRVFDMLSTAPVEPAFADTDMFLLGGSGHYSAAGSGDWLVRALEVLRKVYDSGKPTFASCWGFQSMARAMGGRVIKDSSRAEVGTHRLFLTDAGHQDRIFAPLGTSFLGQMGHEDRVAELPPGVTLLASSERVENQAYRFNDRPIYCTQFHPELNRDDLLTRVQYYPEYIERIAGMTAEEFRESVLDSPESAALLTRFVAQIFAEG